MKSTALRLSALALCSLALASVAHAQSFVGLNTGGRSLTTFGTNGNSTAPVAISGLSTGDSIVDIDFFSSGGGQLFGMGSSGTLYTIAFNGLTAVATVNNGPVYTPAVAGGTTTIGTPTAIDFNPAANRLRVYSGTANFRITTGAGGILSDDGQLAYVAGDPRFGMTPNLVAAAYINNDMDALTGTTLYSIDATFNTLVVHPATGGPQFSMLQTQDVLTLGGIMIDFGTDTGFDVLTLGGINTAYVSNGNTFYTVSLNMGMVGGVAGDLANAFTVTGLGAGITDFAVVPEPGTYALLTVGVAFGLLAFRRRQARA